MSHVERVTEVREVDDAERVETVSSGTYAARVINFIFGLIIAFILLRVVLLLLGANQGNAIVDFIYAVSGVFVAPFYGMFNNAPTFGASFLDVSALVAIIAYALIDWALVSLVTIGNRHRHVAA